MSTQPGTRVGAVSHSDKDTVYLFGYGIYEGDFVREGLGLFGEAGDERRMAEEYFRARNPKATDAEVKEFGDEVLKNPRIRLDSGKVVWGAQCWWGPEDEVRQSVAGRAAVFVDIDNQMEEARANRAGVGRGDSPAAVAAGDFGE